MDSRRVAIVGGSAGGYGVLDLITKAPSSFRVAVAGRPVVDLNSSILNSDIAPYLLAGFGSPWIAENHERLRHSSPLTG